MNLKALTPAGLKALHEAVRKALAERRRRRSRNEPYKVRYAGLAEVGNRHRGRARQSRRCREADRLDNAVVAPNAMMELNP